MNSPIVLFTFNRLNLLKKTLKSLQNNYLASETDLIVFSDGHKDQENLKDIIPLRNFLKKVNGFKSVLIIERKENLGLEKNIILGLDYIFTKYDRVIVLEDDIITSKYFLNFMNDALLKFKSYKNVCQISGYSFLEAYQNKYKIDDLYFIKGADCLAWGTWKDRWKYYTNDAEYLAKTIINKKLKREFNRDNTYNFYKMLISKSRKNNSWAICWYAINFIENKYTLYPLRSFACHIGNDSTATNYIASKNDPLNVKISKKKLFVRTLEINEKEETYLAYNRFLKDSKGSLYERIKCYLKVFIRENL